MALMRAANLETTGSDHTTVERNLNAHGAQRFEHYAQEAIIGFLRETAFVWEYKVVTIYGNSKMMTDALNELARENWYHYLTVGSRGYFKRAIAQVIDVAVQDRKPEPQIAISDAKTDRTGVPQMVSRHANRAARRGR